MVLDFIKIFHFLKDDGIDLHPFGKWKKINDSVKIKSEWKTVNGGTEDKFNKLSENTILVNDFAEEKKTPNFFKKFNRKEWN